MWQILTLGVLISFSIVFIIQQIYHLIIFGKVAFNKNQNAKSSFVPVSVVICAKNEAQNLHKNLPFIFDQDYPEFQVVVVNDCSSDETADILE